MFRKKIGITQNLMINEKYNQIISTLDVSWNLFLQSINMLPIPLPFVETNEIPNMLNSLDIEGIILSGGITCSDYLELKDANYQISTQRDIFEKALVIEAIRRRMPVLGVCRGLQIMNLKFGGKMQKCSGHAGERHDLFSTHGCIKFEFSKVVNSFHNFSIPFNMLSDQLVPLATDSQKNVEAVIHRNGHLYGIMWHPERNKPFDCNDQQLLKTVFT